jgi:hypothetical protein
LLHVLAIVFIDRFPERVPNEPVAYLPPGMSDLSVVGEAEIVEI